MSFKELMGVSSWLLVTLFTNKVHCQINIDNSVAGDALAKSIMAPANIVKPGSVNLNCPQGAYGAFTNGISDGLGIDNGIILTTGQTSVFEQDNTLGSAGANNGVSGFIDPDLQAIEPLATYDGCVIEFDIEPVCDRLVLDYIWGSDEYPEYVNGGYNDAFGFFVSGPGITGTQNIATVPGTTTLVSIDNVNTGSNAAYYVDNTTGNRVEYDGYTQDLSAVVTVVPCETYHLKIVVADAGDGIYDSGVLIAVNNPPCPINNVEWVGIDTVGVEGCQDLNLELHRSGVIAESIVVDFEVLGTADDGTDYTFGLTNYTYAAGDSIFNLNIPVLSDLITEGQETITLIASASNCSAPYSDTITVVINEGGLELDSTIIPESCIGMCDGSLTVTGIGNAPFTYNWENGETTSLISDLCAGDYEITVTDALGCSTTDTLVITSGGNTADASITSPQDSLCINASAITLTAATIGGTWAGNGIDVNGVFTPNTAGVGTHIIEYQIDGACGDTGTYELVVNALPTPDLGQDTTICIGDPAVTFNAGNYTSFLWEGTETSQTISTDVDGTYIVSVVDTNGCEANDTAVLTVNPLPTPDLGNDTAICVGDAAITFDAGVYDAYLWAGTETTQSISTDIDGSYIVTVTDTNGCVANDTVVLKVNPLPSPNLGNDTAICANATALTFDAGNYIGFEWQPNGEITQSIQTNIGGQYIVEVTDTNGCKGLDTLILTINPTKNANIQGPDTNKVCILQNTYDLIVDSTNGTWNNPNINQIGNTATVDLTALGIGTHELIYAFNDPCGDADTVWIKINGQVLATMDPQGPFCEDNNILTFSSVNTGGTWSGQGIVAANLGEYNPSIAGAGIHDVVYTIPGACGDVDTIQVEVVAYDDPTITITDTLVCDDFGPINLTNNQTGGQWETISNSTALDTTLGVFNTTTAGAGNYNLTYSFSGLCPSSDTLLIEVQGYPDSLVTPVAQLCDSWAPVSLIPNTIGGTFTGTGASNTPPVFNPQTAGPGIHDINYIVGGLCIAQYNFTIEVLPQQSASIDPIPEICVLEDSIQLNATSSANGVWTGVAIINDTLGIFSAAQAGGGTHTIAFKIGGQCGDTATYDVVVKNPIDAHIFPPTPICEGFDTLQIETLNDGGSWSGGITDQSGNVNNNLTEGKYNIVYSFNDVCFSSDSVELEILDVPATDFLVTPRSGCIPLHVGIFDISDSLAVNTYWNFGNGEEAFTTDTASTTYFEEGCYDVSMYNEYANGCSDSAIKEDAVCAYPLPEADFSFLPDNPDITNQIIELYNRSTPDANYWWDLGPKAAEQFSNDENPLAIYTLYEEDTVAISLNVVNVHGCLDSMMRSVIIEDIPTLYIPNSFTPNGDGINDIFYGATNNYKVTKYKMLIFNRWGDKIFESSSPYDGWDGIVQEGYSTGNEAQIDTYVYKIYFETEKETNIPQQLVGHVSLLR